MKMSKFETVLSDEEMASIANNKDLHTTEQKYRHVEQAVLAKLAEQRPIYYLLGDPKDKPRVLSTEFMSRPNTFSVDAVITPVFTHPMPNSKGILDSSNHIADMRNMVADMYWINPDYPSYTSILDAFDPVQSAFEVEIGDQFEVSRAKTLPDLTIEVTELEENGDVKDYKILSGDHFADASKMVPEGWQPIQTAPKNGYVLLYREGDGIAYGRYCSDSYNKTPRPYWDCTATEARGVMWSRKNIPSHWMPLPAAPKYTGENK